MIKSHEEDEFIAVRVQDPRIQNEGSWNSYVDYKIFLHTNSKAFTAKTSCVRRRYSEFAWLRKRLQKNTGLVPVADLPGRSFFSFSNEDFLESRRTGLQLFLDKVLHTTVCLSDSQLHLFLQTQLPVGHILDCVQGHTPYTVTDAILTYASSNQGWAQAQEEDPTQEPSSLTQVPYESMESPAPHLPIMQNKEANPALITSHDPDHPQSTVEVQDIDTVELQFSNDETPSLKVLQKNNHLEALLERHSPGGATFFLGDIHDETGPERSSPEEDIQPRTYRIQTPVDVHSPMGTGFQDDREMGLEGVIEDDGTVREESCITLDQAKEMIDPSALSIPYHGTREEEDRQGDSLRLEVLECHVLSQEPVLEHVISQEHVTECDDSAEEQVLEHVISKEVLGHVSSEAVPEHYVISEEVPDQAISEDQILEHVSSHEEELLDYVGSVETVVEQIHSEEQATKHGSSEEKVLEQVHSEEQAPEHHVSTDGVLEHVSPEEKVTEQGSCAEQVLDYVPSEEHILEHVSFEDQIVEWVSSHEEQLFEEEVPEHVHSEEEAPDQHVSSDDVLEHIYKNNVLEHAHSVAQAQEHLCSEHNVSTDDKVLEHVSSEKVLEGSFLCNEEQVPKNVSLPEEGVLEVGCNEESRSSGGEMDESDNQEHLNETELNLEISEEEKRTVECGGDGTIQEQQTPLDQDCSDQEVDETSDKEDGHLSDKCLNKDSDGEEEEVIQETNGYIEIAGEVSENQNTDILEVQASKRPTETDRSSEANDAQEEENAAYMTNNGSLDKGLDSSGSVGSGDLTKSSESDIQDSK